MYLPDAALQKLNEARQAAAKHSDCLLSFGDHPFKALPHGASGGYRFGVESEEFGRVFFSEVPAQGIKVELGSFALWREGPVQAVETLRDAVNAFLRRSGADARWVLRPHRVDLTVDFQGVTPRPHWKTSMVTNFSTPVKASESYVPVDIWADRLTQGEPLQERRFGSGLAFSGFTWGSGNPVLVRLYDKTREITDKSPDKAWFRAVWSRSPDYNPDAPVWRLEVECHRALLRTFYVDGVGIETMSDLFGNAASLWSYMVGRVTPRRTGWLELRDLSTATRRERAKVSALWQRLQEASFSFSDPAGDQLTRMRSAASAHMATAMALGCASTLASATGVVPDLLARHGRPPTAEEIRDETLLRLFADMTDKAFSLEVLKKDAKRADLSPEMAALLEAFRKKPPPRPRVLERPDPSARTLAIVGARADYYREHEPDPGWWLGADKGEPCSSTERRTDSDG